MICRFCGDETFNSKDICFPCSALKAHFERERQKPVFVPKWGAIFAALAVFSAVAYMLWQIWRAWPLLMGALK